MKITEEVKKNILEYYNLGYSDRKISSLIGCSKGTIFIFRCKNKLIANNPRVDGEHRLSGNKFNQFLFNLKGQHKEYMKDYISKQDFREKRRMYDRRHNVKLKKKEYLQRSEVKERRKEYMEKYRKKSGFREKKFEYDNKPEARERAREYQKRYREKNKLVTTL